jgi:two-component system, OmpR family, response regulator ChvI
VTVTGQLAVVDDEESIRQTVGLALRREGFEVSTWDDGQAAWEAFRERLPDLVVLDILMPRMDGLELCRRLRGLSETLPILFLTSKDEEFDRVLGLELGADDYLCKPFSMRELVARVRVLLRRRALRRDPTTATKVLSAGDLMLDLDRFQATWKGTMLQLTVTEFRILHALARHAGRVKTREQLVEDGYPEDTYVSDRTVDTHIKRLRKKLEHADPTADPIETIYGLGYRWR